MTPEWNHVRPALSSDNALGHWGTGWVRCGYPTLQMPDKFAAAMMCTEIGDSCVRAPWSEFLIRVPRGVIEGVDYLTVSRFVSDNEESRLLNEGDPITVWSFAVFDDASETTRAWCYSASKPLRYGEPSVGAPIDAELEQHGFSSSERWHVVLMRLALNACAWIVDHPPKRAGKVRPSDYKPLSSNVYSSKGWAVDYVIGRPVSVDFRQGVRDYIGGRRSATRSVRWITRGHWRNQAVGSGRKEHRLLWIEPHWNNRADLPLLVRPHEVRL